MKRSTPYRRTGLILSRGEMPKELAIEKRTQYRSVSLPLYLPPPACSFARGPFPYIVEKFLEDKLYLAVLTDDSLVVRHPLRKNLRFFICYFDEARFTNRGICAPSSLPESWGGVWMADLTCASAFLSGTLSMISTHLSSTSYPRGSCKLVRKCNRNPYEFH